MAGATVTSPVMLALRRPGFSVFDDQSTPRAKSRQAPLPKQDPHSAGSITNLTETAPPDASISDRRRGSTGQQDLNPRQLQLLKGMLSTPNPNDLSSSVDFSSFYATDARVLSPVISNAASTVRSPYGASEDEEITAGKDAQVGMEKKKRNRRISLVGKLGVREILAGLKWTKEKATQRYKQALLTPESNSRRSVDLEGAVSRPSIDHKGSRDPLENSVQDAERDAACSKDNLNVSRPAQAGAPPSPYKRNRRRSLASIFKFGSASTAPAEDKVVHSSRSRVDLASPSGYSSSYNTSSRADDSTGPDADSDWDQLNSPSDIPGRHLTSRHTRSSAQDLSSTVLKGGRPAPINIPVSNSSRAGSSRHASASRNTFASASASSASLVSSSVYGSAASQASLHESFGGRGGSGNEDERRRLKKAPMRQSRRPPSTGARRSQPSSSQHSSPGKKLSSTPPVVTSPILNRPYYSTRSATGHSPPVPENSTHPYSSASTRLAPIHGTSASSSTDLSQSRLALTPGNIVPLLVYAREVKLKLADCLVELKALETDLLLSKVGGEYLENDGTVEFVPEDGEW